jgi:hypothetical protein
MGKHNLAIKEITCVIVIKTMKNYQWMCLKILKTNSGTSSCIQSHQGAQA